MEQEKKRFFENEQTRRDFLKFSGKSVGGAIVSLSVLNLIGCAPEEAAAPPVETALAFLLPQGMLVADKAKCTGCQRCESICTALHDGKINQYTSRVRVWENYNYGPDGPKINWANADGNFGNKLMNPETCKQCREPFCGNACPVGAISADPAWNNARVVDTEKCIGCGVCAEACPWHMPRLDPQTNKSSKCVACGACATYCPTDALKVIPWEDIKVAMRRYNKRTFA